MSMREVLNKNNLFCLIAIQGQLQNPVKSLNANKETYYQFDVKIPRVSDDDNIYGTGFNRIHAVIAANTVKELKISDEMIKSLKNNEVYVELQMASRVDTVRKDDHENKYNNVRFYATCIELVGEIKTTFINKSVNVAL